MRFVVAGVTGRVGSVVARELVATGHQVHGLVRSPSEDLRRAGIDQRVGSLADERWLTGVLEGAHGFHTLLPEPMDEPDIVGARRAMARAIAGAVAASGMPRVVQLSATAACLTSGNGPAREVRVLEDLLRAGRARVTSVRAALFSDGIAAFLPAARQGVLPTLLPSPDAAVPMVATRDIGVICAAELLRTPATSEIVDVMEAFYSPREMATILATALGHHIEVAVIPPDAQVDQLAQAGMPRIVAEQVVELMAAAVAGRVVPCGDRRVAGSTPLSVVLGAILERVPTVA